MTAPEPREDVAVAEVLTDDELNELVDLIAEARDRAPRLPTDADSWDVLAAIEPVIGRIIAERVRAAAVEAWDEGWWKGQQDRDPTVLGYAENPYRGSGK